MSGRVTTLGVTDARAELEALSRVSVDKLSTAAEAVRRLVPNGALVGVGGTNHARTPMALLIEILRQGRSGLTMTRPLSCIEAELMLATDTAERIMTSWVGVGHGWGLAPVVRRLVEAGRPVFEEWSHLGIGLRYKAGAMGVPYLPTVSMLGSDIDHQLDLAKVTCPYTGQILNAVPSLNPDVALIHVQRADRQGNAQIDGYQLMDADLALAARRVILTAEEIVDTDEFRRDPARTVIPGFAVDAVVHQPMGAYPHECYGHYEADLDEFTAYMQAVKSGGVEGARAYVAALTAYPDHDAFCASLDPTRLAALRRTAEEMLPR
ncbi:CoA transferase subunit A [Mycolicibacterium sp. S2-37]|uniref:CoA transferase subunit A n=1 Tax=Mycolicibacterium sp. S2-37 TaxID=2810297 RepID=UPI001A9458BA|nr:CoA transferase subunit A [Mycolicibacterium sp. S2-37]MBO0679087.1 CoA transferase subunit A [Mycolicibacterium sp. S2-37]